MSTPLPKPDPNPSSIPLSAVADIPLHKEDGSTIPFSDLYSKPGRHMIIFNRHFFCNLCEDYTSALQSTLPPTLVPEGTSLSLISTGDHTLIPIYLSRTGSTYPVYADQTAALYKKLGMHVTMRTGPKASYQKGSLWFNVKIGIAHAWRDRANAKKTGPPLQQGGEILVVNEGGAARVEWCHFMKHFSDHTDVADIKRLVLGSGAGEESVQAEKEPAAVVAPAQVAVAVA